MSKLPSFKPRKLEKILAKNGFVLIRQSGSHRTYYNSQIDATTFVAYHGKDIPIGTLKSIIKQSKLGENAFLKN